MLLNISKLKKSIVSSVDNIASNLNKVTRKTMFTTRNLTNKAVNMNLIRSSNHVGVSGTRTETAIHSHTLQSRVDQNNMATLVAYKLKKNAAKDLANDGSGQHAHVCKETCVQNDCEEKKMYVLM